jgi:hypothetical protein
MFNRAVNEAFAAPETKDKLLQAGFLARGSSAQAPGVLTQAEYERFADVARNANMAVD